MDSGELGRIGERLRTRIETALDGDDREDAERACAGLAKEYVLVHKGLRRVLEYAMEYIEGAFREEQADIAAGITAAVRAGDSGRARALLRERDRQHVVIHDQFIEMKAGFYSYVGIVFGARRLEEILRHTGERQRTGFERWEAMDAEDFVRASAHLLKGHMSTLRVTEDEERFTIEQDPCGSGGRLMREGSYDGADGLHRVGKARPMTFGKPDFPSYCAHCAVWNNIQCIEWFGHPQWCIEHPREANEPCRIHIYKSAAKIPEKFFRQVGKSRGEGAEVVRATENNDG